MSKISKAIASVIVPFVMAGLTALAAWADVPLPEAMVDHVFEVVLALVGLGLANFGVVYKAPKNSEPEAGPAAGGEGSTLRAAALAVVLAVLLLGGCTAQHKAGVQAGIGAVQDGNDTIAESLTSALCGMTVGAYYRLKSATDRKAVAMLCGGEIAQPITAAQIDTLSEVLRLGRPAEAPGE